eukprot:CAMPEP_0119262084 /NCGR_PEP_ID=MMETSP1329-20130426/1917_1 /TAXON_ID=114041 /ORGANISM="Genus nov. species nov., Strain RCC1024" /LENGTH=286 /DNA_ID=CAMNT_0007261693 /DNA_START=195 /DNA_END=1052 /DNA_ORIENTATION=+
MHERVRTLWCRVVAEDEADASRWYNLANATARTGNVDAALLAYAHALRGPAGAELRQATWANAAALCIRARQPAAAAACGCAALAAGVRAQAPLLYNLNTALRQTGDQARAVRASWRHVAVRATSAAPYLASFAAARAAGGAPLLQAPSHAQLRQQSPCVVCVKWGSKYDAAYANRLGRAVGRHLPGTARVVCFTDDTAGLDARAIEARPLPVGTTLEAWWLKAFLFSSAAGLQGPVLYLDLDTVICGPLSALAARATASGSGGLVVLGTDNLENENRAGGYNSSV